VRRPRTPLSSVTLAPYLGWRLGGAHRSPLLEGEGKGKSGKVSSIGWVPRTLALSPWERKLILAPMGFGESLARTAQGQ
jgi:hypothetical protein